MFGNMDKIKNSSEPPSASRPIYSIVGSQAVKLIRIEDSGIGAYADNRKTGQFKLAMKYLDQVLFGKDDVELVSETEFELYTESLSQQE